MFHNRRVEGDDPSPLFSSGVVTAVLCPLLHRVQAGEQRQRGGPAQSQQREEQQSLVTGNVPSDGRWGLCEAVGVVARRSSQTPPAPCSSGTISTDYRELAGCSLPGHQQSSALSLALRLLFHIINIYMLSRSWFHPKIKELPIVRNTYPRISPQCWKCWCRISWDAEFVCLMSVSHPWATCWFAAIRIATLVTLLQGKSFPWCTPSLPLPCASTGLSGCTWPKALVPSPAMQAVLTAPALMGPPTGASAPRHPWFFSSLTWRSLFFSLLCKRSPTLLV